VPRAVTPASDPGTVGDEPVMLARRAGCPVWVCADRPAALDAARRGGADVVLADDGLQQPRLPRSYEICVIDGLRGLGNGCLLPAGPLRQPVERLQRVDQVLLKRSGDAAVPELDVDPTGFSVVPGRPYRIGPTSGGVLPSSEEFDAVCAIGNPDSFFELLSAEGYRFRPRPFPDHHAFEHQDLDRLPGPLLVTEKDAVKLERLEGLPETWVLPIEAALPACVVEAVETHVREFRPS
jgi:tetraacyldisaccharide 4'-kinase